MNATSTNLEPAELTRKLTEAETRVAELEQQLQKQAIDNAALAQELKRTHHLLMVSEKMAALGQLLTNVGHEINTPVSAMKSSAQSIERMLGPLVQELPGLFAAVQGDANHLLLKLLITAANNDTSLTTKEERYYRKELEEQFTEAGLDDPADLAKTLIEIQMIDVQEFLPLLKHDEAPAIMQVLKYVAGLKAAVLNLNLAAEKTAKIILALKSYSHVNRDEKLEPVNLESNLQSILTIYHNLLKHGVQVIKNYEEIPPIMGISDQLGQVWANLIHNAIQAMKGTGTLTLEIARDTQYAIVRVMDSGEGISQENINRIFEPFFTTKVQGEGSGLGLDICRRIVERHAGKISVDSEPGRTVFTVMLPFEAPSIN